MPQRQPENANSNLKLWQTKGDSEELWLERCEAYAKIGGGGLGKLQTTEDESPECEKMSVFSVNSFNTIICYKMMCKYLKTMSIFVIYIILTPVT